MTVDRRRLLVVSGGLGTPSTSRLLADRLAEAAVSAVETQGGVIEVETLELREIAVDVTHSMLAGFPSGGAARAVASLRRADALVLVTPLFTAGVSGLVKSFLDILPTGILDGLPVVLAATAGTSRHTLALDYAMRPVLGYLRAEVVPTIVVAAGSDWSGEPGDAEALTSRIGRAADELIVMLGRSSRRSVADEFEAAPSFTDLMRGLSAGR